ncbi:MAG: NAD(P)H-dependent glycerol-3-phosphate dehydrogenase [Kiritimatiellia bacterium]|jgi:glycerol-3-phosphate dehydrogenase (NAD(P)+)|nr:NAD(P)-dependent glycerol-3-phosphate dehydrogenase [Lentisphaerota bacterium]
MNVAVLGDGGWGSALALTLHRHGHTPCVWGPSADYIAEIRQTRQNRKFLPGVEFPPAITWTADPSTALASATAVVLAVPSRYVRATLGRFAPAYQAAGAPPVVSATKGFDETTHQRISEILAEIWGVAAPAALSGPSIAPETARGVPTAVTIASADPVVAETFQKLFCGDTFRSYTSNDVPGVELGGALKNVIAIAAGVCDGLGFGHNAKAALITRGLAEMTRLGVALGAHPQTFSGLAGVGDLMVTCMSPQSRNRTLGERLGRGETLAAILDGMEQVAEGVWTCPPALKLAAAAGVATPLMSQVDAILHHGQSPRTAVIELMRRDPRAERD